MFGAELGRPNNALNVQTATIVVGHSCNTCFIACCTIRTKHAEAYQGLFPRGRSSIITPTTAMGASC